MAAALFPVRLSRRLSAIRGGRVLLCDDIAVLLNFYGLFCVKFILFLGRFTRLLDVRARGLVRFNC